MIRDGLRALQARDKAIEHWLRNEVVTAYEAMRTDPDRGRSLEEARAALHERHARAAKTVDR